MIQQDRRVFYAWFDFVKADGQNKIYLYIGVFQPFKGKGEVS